MVLKWFCSAAALVNWKITVMIVMTQDCLILLPLCVCVSSLPLQKGMWKCRYEGWTVSERQKFKMEKQKCRFKLGHQLVEGQTCHLALPSDPLDENHDGCAERLSTSLSAIACGHQGIKPVHGHIRWTIWWKSRKLLVLAERKTNFVFVEQTKWSPSSKRWTRSSVGGVNNIFFGPVAGRVRKQSRDCKKKWHIHVEGSFQHFVDRSWFANLWPMAVRTWYLEKWLRVSWPGYLRPRNNTARYVHMGIDAWQASPFENKLIKF